MNNTANPVTSACTVEEICGFGGMSASHTFSCHIPIRFAGFHDETPNQWFRLESFTFNLQINHIKFMEGSSHLYSSMRESSIFSSTCLHNLPYLLRYAAGCTPSHWLLFKLLFRLRERWAREGLLFYILLLEFLGVSILYFTVDTSWIVRFRNVLGGNFALVGIPSVGASGAIFGTAAVRTFLDSMITTSSKGVPGCMGRSYSSLEVSLSTRQESTSINLNESHPLNPPPSLFLWSSSLSLVLPSDSYHVRLSACFIAFTPLILKFAQILITLVWIYLQFCLRSFWHWTYYSSHWRFCHGSPGRHNTLSCY